MRIKFDTEYLLTKEVFKDEDYEFRTFPLPEPISFRIVSADLSEDECRFVLKYEDGTETLLSSVWLNFYFDQDCIQKVD